MNAADLNFLKISGRVRALEQMMTVMLIDWADRDSGDPLIRLEAARKNSMLTIQMQDRQVDEANDLEADSMAESLSEIFADASAWFQSSPRGE